LLMAGVKPSEAILTTPATTQDTEVERVF